MNGPTLALAERGEALREALESAQTLNKGCSIAMVPLLWLAHQFKYGRKPSFDAAMRDWAHFLPEWPRWVEALAAVVPENLEWFADVGETSLLFASDELGTVPHICAPTQQRLLDLAKMRGDVFTALALGSLIRGQSPEPAFDEAATLFDADAAHALGLRLYAQGDLRRALLYSERAHALGNAESAYVAASILLKSNAERKNRSELERARVLLEEAEQSGDRRCRKNLALVRYWLDPSDPSLLEQLHSVYADDCAREDQAREIRAIIESGQAEMQAELQRLELKRKLEKRVRQKDAAARSDAKAAAYVQQRTLEREQALRDEALTPQPTQEETDFSWVFEELVSRSGEQRPLSNTDDASSPASLASKDPMGDSNIDGELPSGEQLPLPHAGGDSSGPASLASEAPLDSGYVDLDGFFDGICGLTTRLESPSASPAAPQQDQPNSPPTRLESPSADPAAPHQDRPNNPPTRQGIESPSADPAAPQRDRSNRRGRKKPSPNPAQPKKLGRPKGAKDTKPRAPYGSLSTGKTGRVPGRPLGSKDSKTRKPRTKPEKSEGSERGNDPRVTKKPKQQPKASSEREDTESADEDSEREQARREQLPRAAKAKSAASESTADGLTALLSATEAARAGMKATSSRPRREDSSASSADSDSEWTCD